MKIFNLRVTKHKRQNLRNNVMMPERILWKYIKGRQLGYKFRRQHGIGKYIVDFYCPELFLVIEIDGRVHGEDEVMKKDAVRDSFMNCMGLEIKRYTAQEINDNIENILNDLKNLCDKLSDGKPHLTSH